LPTENEISSTEKLLKQIRGEKTGTVSALEEIQPAATAESPAAPSLPKKKKAIMPKFFSSPLQITIGVDFDLRRSEIRFAKLAQISEQNWRLLGCHKVSFAPGTYMETPEFASLLKQALKWFCGSPSKKINIWSNIPSAHVELRYFRIPRVPRKQLVRTVQFAFRKEVPFDEKHSFFDFEVLGEVTDNGVRKLSVVAYTASKAEVEATKNLFNKCGYPLTGITIVPFAIQNILRTGWVPEGNKRVVCNLYIGTDWSRIDIFAEGKLLVMRGVKTGLNSMAEAIADEMNAKWAMLDTPKLAHTEKGDGAGSDFDFNESVHGGGFSGESEDEAVSLSMEIELRADQQGPVTADEALKILFSLSPDSEQLSEEDPGYKLSHDEIYEMIYPAVDRLVRQIERTFQHFTTTFHGESVAKIYISGKMDLSGGLSSYIASQIGIPTEVINPFGPDNPFANEVSGTSRLNFTEKLSFAPTIGLSLSDNDRTPNFIYTYKEKSKKIIVSRFDRAVFIAFLVSISICVGISVWQNRELKAKNQMVDNLKQQLELFTPEPDKNLIANLAVKIALRRQELRKYSQRYRGMASIGEISALTPSNISLLSSSISFPDGPGGKGVILLDGVVRGKRRILEAALAGYVLKLAGSPLFEQPSIKQSTIETETENGNDVLNFSVQLEIR